MKRLLHIICTIFLATGCVMATDEAETFEGEQLELSESGLVTDRPLTPQTCSSPLGAADVSRPTTVVGNGTAASCTEAALRAAVAKGGVITFSCGTTTKRITLTRPLEAPWDRDTTLDGGYRIILDGAGKTQLLRSVHGDFRANDRVLTVQRLTFTRGRDAGTDFVPRNGQKTCAWGYKHGGGGAIYVRDVNLHVWGVKFLSNHGPALGPDVAGGAIYAFGAKEVTIANSVFRSNSASNGGALGMLHSSARLYNVLFDKNQAKGMYANFANASGCPTFNHAQQGGAGGLGGAFYSDGFDPGDQLCGVTMSGNVSGDLGGAVFRSAYWGLLPDVGRQVISWDRCTFSDNFSQRGGGGAAYVNNSLFRVTGSQFSGNDSGESDGGALKLTGLTVQAGNVSFRDNLASWGGAVAHWGAGPEGAGSASGLTFSNNAPNDTVGDFPR